MARPRPKQTGFTFRTWGGRRHGAGRKPKGDKAGVPHRPRPALASRFPVHVSLRVRQGLPSLRSRKAYKAVEQALLQGCQRDGFRLVHFCILNNHIHLIVEAKDGRVLARRIQGLSISLARRLNHRLGRRGAVFADRYHARILRTPRETRTALLYVLNNRRSHAARRGKRDRLPPGGADHYSSGPWFDGWRTPPRNRSDDGRAPPLTAPARTWLLSKGWRRHGLLALDEVPGQ
jgi:REP element-mobilizing transposase RayT